MVDSEFPVQPFVDAGYHVVFRGEKSYNGVAVLSRHPATDISFGFDDGEPADETRLVCVTVGPVGIVNTYVPQGRELDHPLYAYKLRWFRRLCEYFERHYTPRDRLVWVGDLNVAPSAMDIHNASQQTEHVCYHADVRQAFAGVMAWGWVDVFRKHHPEPGHYSYFDYRTVDAVKRNMGWRVDHILATVPLAAASTDCFIDRAPRLAEKPSDHTFVMAEFDV